MKICKRCSQEVEALARDKRNGRECTFCVACQDRARRYRDEAKVKVKTERNKSLDIPWPATIGI